MNTAIKFILTVVLLVAAASAQDNFVASIRNYRVKNEQRLLSDFTQFLSIPNIASDIPKVYLNADYLVERMKRMGLNPKTFYLGDKGSPPPVVYGEWKTQGAARTIIFYAHYDGQPVDPKAWTEIGRAHV